MESFTPETIVNQPLTTLLQDLQLDLTKKLLERIRDGTATPADLNVARQLLKDNCITSLPQANKPLADLGLEFPRFADEKLEVA